MTKLVGNDLTELHTNVKFRNRESLMAHDLQHLDARARLAVSMIEHWGVVAGRPGGREDDPREMSAKHITNMSPEETVDRACDLAACAYAAFEARGWLLPVPSFDELTKDED